MRIRTREISTIAAVAIIVWSLCRSLACAQAAFRDQQSSDTKTAEPHVVAFPSTTGPYQVGRASYHLVDEARQETFTAEPDDFRELMVTVHYPAKVAVDVRPSPYADDKLAAAIAEAYHRPASFAGLVHSHAVERAPGVRREAGFPVVVFSPGFKAHPLFYTATLEELASQGFVVVSVCHPYSTGVTVFPDGRAVRANDEGTRFELDKDDPDVSPQTVEKHRDAIGEVWIADVRFVADSLERFNKDDELLAGAMDLSRLGIFGHSFGGATAAAAVERDKRFRAGINLDGSDFSGTRGEKIGDSFLWLCSEPPDISNLPPHVIHRSGDARKPSGDQPTDAPRRASEGLPADRSRVLLKKPGDPDLPNFDPAKGAPRIYNGMQSTPGARITIRGSRHQTFESDVALLAATSPLARAAAGTGTIDGPRAVLVINSLVTGFFRKHLRGDTVPLLDDPSSQFPEAARDK